MSRFNIDIAIEYVAVAIGDRLSVQCGCVNGVMGEGAEEGRR